MDFNYIKNHYRLIAVDLSRQKKLDFDPKAIQQMKFVKQLKNVDSINADGTQSMFILKILQKIKETRLKFPQASVAELQKIANYQEAIVKLTNTQLKSTAKNETEAIWKIHKKNFEDEDLPHELLLTTRQTNKTKNVFANNKSTDLTLSKAQISKIIQSGGSFGSWLGNLGKKALINIDIPLARDNLPGLVTI